MTRIALLLAFVGLVPACSKDNPYFCDDACKMMADAAVEQTGCTTNDSTLCTPRADWSYLPPLLAYFSWGPLAPRPSGALFEFAHPAISKGIAHINRRFKTRYMVPQLKDGC